MSKNAPQQRRQASTHYHDAARQHQEAAHFAKLFGTKEQRTARTTRRNSTNSRRTSKTNR